MSNQLKEGHIKVQLDYAPKTNGKEFKAWCEDHGFDYLNSGRRAWCAQLSTYFRGAAGVAYNDGEQFLFYEEDVVDIDQYTQRLVLEGRLEEAKHMAYAKSSNLARLYGLEKMEWGYLVNEGYVSAYELEHIAELQSQLDKLKEEK